MSEIKCSRCKGNNVTVNNLQQFICMNCGLIIIDIIPKNGEHIVHGLVKWACGVKEKLWRDRISNEREVS